MTHKTLAELRADWRRSLWTAYRRHLPVSLLVAPVAAWLLRALYLPHMPTVVPGAPVLTYILQAPYIVHVAMLLPYGLLAPVPLVLACAGPYPSKEDFELNETIRQARAARAADTTKQGD